MSSSKGYKSGVDVSVGIDKIKLQMPLAGPNDPIYQAVRAWVYSVRAHDFDISGMKPGTFKRLKKPAAMTLANQPLASGGSLTVKYGFHSGHLRVWLEFNPSTCCLRDLANMFELLFPRGFETIYQAGRANYIEVKIDVSPGTFADYVYIDPKLQVAYKAYAEQGTLYLGSPAGHRSFTIYDKSKQSAEVHKLLLPRETIRIEAKLRDPSRLASTLGCLPNPFITLRVMRRSSLELMGGCVPSVAALAETAQFLETQPEAAASAQPGWWDPPGIFACLDTDRWVQPLRNAGIHGAAILGGEGYDCFGTNHVPPSGFFGHSAIDCSAECVL